MGYLVNQSKHLLTIRTKILYRENYSYNNPIKGQTAEFSHLSLVSEQNKQEIAHKKKELASQTLHLVQKNTWHAFYRPPH